MQQIEVLDLKPLEKPGNLKAFVSVQVHGITIRDCRIVQQPGQQAWLSPPQQSYEVAGERKWKAIVEFPKELRKEIEAVVLEAWQGKDKPLTTTPKPYAEAGDYGGIDGGDAPVRRRAPF
jgi:hypothetical protein